MPKVIMVIRELDRNKPEYHQHFDVPEIPKVGDYISVFRPDSSRSEDVVVRHVWWHLSYPMERSSQPMPSRTPVGHVLDIMIECDIAVGPYARETWRAYTDAAKQRGVKILEFEVSRVVAPEFDPRA